MYFQNSYKYNLKKQDIKFDRENYFDERLIVPFLKDLTLVPIKFVYSPKPQDKKTESADPNTKIADYQKSMESYISAFDKINNKKPEEITAEDIKKAEKIIASRPKKLYDEDMTEEEIKKMNSNKDLIKSEIIEKLEGDADTAQEIALKAVEELKKDKANTRVLKKTGIKSLPMRDYTKSIYFNDDALNVGDEEEKGAVKKAKKNAKLREGGATKFNYKTYDDCLQTIVIRERLFKNHPEKVKDVAKKTFGDRIRDIKSDMKKGMGEEDYRNFIETDRFGSEFVRAFGKELIKPPSEYNQVEITKSIEKLIKNEWLPFEQNSDGETEKTSGTLQTMFNTSKSEGKESVLGETIKNDPTDEIALSILKAINVINKANEIPSERRSQEIEDEKESSKKFIEARGVDFNDLMKKIENFNEKGKKDFIKEEIAKGTIRKEPMSKLEMTSKGIVKKDVKEVKKSKVIDLDGTILTEDSMNEEEDEFNKQLIIRQQADVNKKFGKIITYNSYLDYEKEVLDLVEEIKREVDKESDTEKKKTKMNDYIQRSTADFKPVSKTNKPLNKTDKQIDLFAAHLIKKYYLNKYYLKK